VIEMHQGDEPYDDEIGDDDPAPGPVRRFMWLIFGAPSMAIAGLSIGVANLMLSRTVTNIAETRLVSSTGRHVSDLTEIRASSLIHLIMGVAGLAMAVASVIRLRAEPHDGTAADGSDIDPPWLLGVAGAGVMVGLIGVALAAIALGYAMHADAGPFFNGFAP
jgi:hypothetical protein